MSDKLNTAMDMVAELNKSHGVTQRGGKKYTQVVHRMEAFRRVFGMDYGIKTEVLKDDGQIVQVRADIYALTNDQIPVGTGMAEELRGAGNVNKTSALENCESSAIGRALASLGLAGGEYASSNEMAAVVRKEAIINDEPEPQEEEEKPQPEPQPEPQPAGEHDEDDRKRYLFIRNALKDAKFLAAVHGIYKNHEKALLEIKERDESKYESFMKLFKKAEERVKGS